MDRSSRQKLNKETKDLNDTIDQIDLTNIYRTFHGKQQITLSSQVHMEHSPGQITSWIRNQAWVNLRIEIISSIFFDHNAMRLEINYRGKNHKNTNTWRLNNTLLNNQEITEEIKKEMKKISRGK